MQGLAEDDFFTGRDACATISQGIRWRRRPCLRGLDKRPDVTRGIAAYGHVDILQRLLADLGELRIHFLARDGTLLDVDDGATAEGPKSRFTGAVDHDLAAIGILAWRADDRLDGRIGDLADALEHVAYLAAFQFE